MYHQEHVHWPTMEKSKRLDDHVPILVLCSFRIGRGRRHKKRARRERERRCFGMESDNAQYAHKTLWTACRIRWNLSFSRMGGLQYTCTAHCVDYGYVVQHISCEGENLCFSLHEEERRSAVLWWRSGQSAPLVFMLQQQQHLNSSHNGGKYHNAKL